MKGKNKKKEPDYFLKLFSNEFKSIFNQVPRIISLD